MRIRCSATLLAAGAVLALTGAAPAQAGLVDGSLNELHVADGSNLLGAFASAHVGAANNNANARADVDVQNNGSVGVDVAVSPDRRAAAKRRRGTSRGAR
jgi:hypothetical protein